MDKSSQKQILIIEDEAPIREMIRFALEEAEFTVFEAEDGRQAALFLADNAPDLSNV